jgi:hypothetical protein
MPKRKILKAGLAAGVVLLRLGVAFPHQPVFGPPQNLGPKVNTMAFEFDPFLTADGKKLFFVRDIGIWCAEWTDTGWTNATILGSQINAGGWPKQSPSVSPDGQKLYYVDAARGGYNWDIWVSTWDSNLNDWGTPVNLGPPVNTPGAELSAHISPDGRHLYFTSEVFYIPDPGDSSRYGMYVSEWNGTSWSDPVEFPDSGTENIGEYPSITADGIWFYFDHGVIDGRSCSVRHWNGSTWEPPVDLRPQIGGRSSSPYIIPSGDSLFISGATIDIGGFGMSDIFLMQRLLPGDLNLDGQLTTADVVLELNAVFLAGAFPAPFASADGNCDGRLTAADVVLLLLRAFLGTPFPCRA